MPRRVAIVDDHVMSRAGSAALLAEQGDLAVASAAGIDAALEWRVEWLTVDILVLDPVDERSDIDQFRGVSVAVAARRWRPNVAIVVVTEHDAHDALRRRLQEVGADYLYGRGEILERGHLVAAVAQPSESHRLPAPDAEALARLGVSTRSRLNQLVAHVAASDLAEVLRRDAEAARVSPRSRRWINLRRELALVGRIDAVNRDGTHPRRDQRLPSLGQFRRLYDWATRLDAPPD